MCREFTHNDILDFQLAGHATGVDLEDLLFAVESLQESLAESEEKLTEAEEDAERYWSRFEEHDGQLTILKDLLSDVLSIVDGKIHDKDFVKAVFADARIAVS